MGWATFWAIFLQNSSGHPEPEALINLSLFSRLAISGNKLCVERPAGLNFSHFGMLYQEKSGNPGSNEFRTLCKNSKRRQNMFLHFR
jgi:hypothetical protein